MKCNIPVHLKFESKTSNKNVTTINTAFWLDDFRVWESFRTVMSGLYRMFLSFFCQVICGWHYCFTDTKWSYKMYVHVGGGVHYCNISSTKINTTKYHRKKIFCTKFTNLEEAHCLNINILVQVTWPLLEVYHV